MGETQKIDCLAENMFFLVKVIKWCTKLLEILISFCNRLILILIVSSRAVLGSRALLSITALLLSNLYFL